MRTLIIFLLILAVSASFVFSQTRDAPRFVAAENLAVRSSTGFFSRNLGTLRFGDSVTPVRESGRWTEIDAATVSGWVLSANLSPRRVLTPGSPVTPAEVALAGKGFGAEIETEYRREGPDFSLVDKMEKISVSLEQLQQFIIDGRLAEGE